MNMTLVARIIAAGILATLWLPAYAEIMDIELPTGEDGKITYKFDTETKLPLSARDDRSEVMTVALSILPKAPGEQIQWAFQYEMRFEDGHEPKSIAIYSENEKPLTIEVQVTNPILKDRTWNATSTNIAPFDERAWKAWTGQDPWILLRKFVITYEDGDVRTLHQLAIITNPMRFKLMEQVLGKSISEPARK